MALRFLTFCASVGS